MIRKINALEQNLTEEKTSRKSQERSSENMNQAQHKIIDTLKETLKNVNNKLEDKIKLIADKEQYIIELKREQQKKENDWNLRRLEDEGQLTKLREENRQLG